MLQKYWVDLIHETFHRCSSMRVCASERKREEHNGIFAEENFYMILVHVKRGTTFSADSVLFFSLSLLLFRFSWWNSAIIAWRSIILHFRLNPLLVREVPFFSHSFLFCHPWSDLKTKITTTRRLCATEMNYKERKSDRDGWTEVKE